MNKLNVNARIMKQTITVAGEKIEKKNSIRIEGIIVDRRMKTGRCNR